MNSTQFGKLSDAAAFDFLQSSDEVLKQDKIELLWVLEEVRDHLGSGVQTVMELGSLFGRNICMLSRIVEETGTIISIEPELEVPLNKALINEVLSVSFVHIKGESQKKSTVDDFAYCLNGGKCDVIFFDGRHYYRGAKGDFLLYSPFIKSPGLAVIHDLTDWTRGPHFLFEEMKDVYRWKAMTVDPRLKGTGILYF